MGIVNIVQVILTIILIGILPIRIILRIEATDNELPKITKKEKVIIYIISIVQIIIFIFTLCNQDNIMYTISILTVTLLLNITSYMDEKIQSFHTWICLLGIIIQIIILIINSIINSIPNKENIIAMIVIIVIMLITSIFGGLGVGDLLLYIMIGLEYLLISPMSYIVIAINIVLSYIVFLIKNIISNKKLNMSNPFTLSIAIVTFIINSIIWLTRV